MCLGTMIWSLTHTESKPKASTCCASRRMFCMVAGCPRLGRLKPNSIRPLLVADDGYCDDGCCSRSPGPEQVRQATLSHLGKSATLANTVSRFDGQLPGEYRLGPRSGYARIGSDCRGK